MNRLLAIGFECAGHWVLRKDRLYVDLKKLDDARNVLYAFVVDGEVKYIGKSVRTLRDRMGNYMSPGASQKQTNFKNNRNIRELLTEGAAVDICVLPDNGMMHYGPYHLNLAAGLEDSLVAALAPEWNGKDKRTLDDAVAASTETDEDIVSDGAEPEAIAQPQDSDESITSETATPALAEFEFKLGTTYWNKGFFNSGTESSAYLGEDSQKVEIYFGDEVQPILGLINRTCNANKAPRIFGGPELRHRFQTLPEFSTVKLEVLSPTAIRLQLSGHPAFSAGQFGGRAGAARLDGNIRPHHMSHFALHGHSSCASERYTHTCLGIPLVGVIPKPL
ncbi:GIY-YIG domain-containing protein [Paraburkholderia sacchari]|uniref:GIY-YIG nuclease family protein n=1 Tax=Paraburkholderia sacchari TaxID=159450 RepID=UPI0039A6B40E